MSYIRIGSTVTFAILYGPQTLIHTFSESFGISPSTASFTVSLALHRTLRLAKLASRGKPEQITPVSST